MNDSLQSRAGRIKNAALICAGLGTLGCMIGAIVSPRQFFISYLWSYVFWLGLALGCMALVMIHSLTSGRWGDVTRRFQEAGFMTLPVMALLFVPICFGLHDLYPWARPEQVALDPVLLKRSAYMGVWQFIVRACVYFAIWILLAVYLRRRSLEQDCVADISSTRRMRTLSGPGLVLYPLTMTFASVDWIMSLEPKWFSTMFPIIACIGQILSALAFSIIMVIAFKTFQPIARALTTAHLHQLGTLLFAFVLFWTYINFGQLLIIYSGNIPREIGWYLHRIGGTWKWMIGAIALFHFFLPFYLMLFRPVKQNYVSLLSIAILVFTIHLVFVLWEVKPTFFPQGIQISWLDFAAPIGLGGIWSFLFISGYIRHELMPRNDPRIQFEPVKHAHAH